MDFLLHNIQRITEWIQSDVNYNFFNPGYKIACYDDQVILQHDDNKFKQGCHHCLFVLKYSLICKYGHLTCVPCFNKYGKYRFMFEIMLPSPICVESCHFNEIYTYQVEKIKRPKSI